MASGADIILEQEDLDALLTREGTRDELAVGGAEASAAQTEMATEKAAVRSFRDKALKTATTFKDYIKSKVTIGDVINLGVAMMMLYDIVNAHAKAADSTGKRTSLSDAIAGAQRTLQDKYDSTIRSNALKEIADTANFATLTDETRQKIQAQASMTGEVYWVLVGEDVMTQLAEMPIYDPTG